jgi:hypothetical protein
MLPIILISISIQNSRSHIDWPKFIHLRSLNVRHFGMKLLIKKYGVEVIFTDMTSLLNFMQIYHMVKKLSVGDTQTHSMVIS